MTMNTRSSVPAPAPTRRLAARRKAVALGLTAAVLIAGAVGLPMLVNAQSGTTAAVSPPMGLASAPASTPISTPVTSASAPVAAVSPAAITPLPNGTLPMPDPSVQAFSLMPPPVPAGPAPDAQVVRGQYLAQAGDCISCHSKPGGKPFAGGLAMNTPFGAIVSTNITPDKSQGIGDYTQEDFNRALREGKAKDGHHLYPAMPYTNFSRLSDEDLTAMYAYFMRGVQPATQDNARTDLPWPFSMRWLMAGWNLLYLPGKVYTAEPAQNAEWNRGAYLVQGLGHCGACHTPRGMTGAEKAATHADGDLFLSGALIDGWYAQPLRNSSEPGLASWSKEELVQYLKTGRTDRTAAFGAMTEVVENSTQHLSSEDLGAIATYLKSLPGKDGGNAPVTPPMTPTAAAASPTGKALLAGDTGRVGALVYLNNCNACHRSDGQGAQKTFPTLAGNSVVNAKDPTSLIRIVLEGSVMAQTQQAPSPIGMPAFGWRLTDANVADVLTLVRGSWGNTGGAVDAAQVAKVRGELAKTAHATKPGGGK